MTATRLNEIKRWHLRHAGMESQRPIAELIEALEAEMAKNSPKKLDPLYLIVQAGVWSSENAKANESQDDQGWLMPFRKGDNWCPIIELSTGKVIRWPEGKTAYIHYIVCDAGEYWIGDANQKPILKWTGPNAPHDLLAAGEGYGDYIIMSIDGSGQIEGWKTPVIDEDEWMPLPKPPTEGEG